MKRMIALLILVPCLCLVSCAKAQYTNDVSCTDLCNKASEMLSDGLEYTEYDASHRKFYFDDTEDYDDCCLIYSTDTANINEIGVFHAPNEDAARDVEEDCFEYIEQMREGERAFIASYAPGELPKLDGATVSRFGRYVVYIIVPTDKRTSVLGAIEDMLRK